VTHGHLTNVRQAQTDPEQQLSLFPCPLYVGTAELALHILGCNVGSLIVQLFAFTETDFQLDPAPLQIHLQRNDRVAFLRGGLFETLDFTLVKKQLPAPHRVMIGNIPVAVGSNVALIQPHFTTLHLTVGLLQVHLPLPDRFHLGTLQNHPRLYPIIDVVFVGCLPVGRYDFVSVSHQSIRVHRRGERRHLHPQEASQTVPAGLRQ